MSEQYCGFDFNKYRDPDYVMICRTPDEIKSFAKILNADGRCWHSGTSYEDFNYSPFHENGIGYVFNRGTYLSYPSACSSTNYKKLYWTSFCQPSLNEISITFDDIIP